MTKGKSKAFWRKQIRAKEKVSKTMVGRDTMMGRATRRFWGAGVAK